MPSFDLYQNQAHTWSTYTHACKTLIHIKSLFKKVLEIHNWSKCRKQLTMEFLAPTDTPTTQSYTQDSGAITEEGRERLLKPKSGHLPKGRLFCRWQRSCIHYILTIQSLKHDLHMIPLVNIPTWMGKLPKARHLDEELQVINSSWEIIRLLHGQAPGRLSSLNWPTRNTCTYKQQEVDSAGCVCMCKSEEESEGEVGRGNNVKAVLI